MFDQFHEVHLLRTDRKMLLSPVAAPSRHSSSTQEGMKVSTKFAGGGERENVTPQAES
jgi:hypothetical protein